MNFIILLECVNTIQFITSVLVILRWFLILKRRNCIKQRKHINCLKIIITLTCILLIIVNTLLIDVIKIRQEMKLAEKDMIEEIMVVRYVPKDILSDLVFQSEVINSSTYAVWENLANIFLHYEYYEEWSRNNNVTKGELRDKYLTRIREESNLPIASIADIQRLVNDFYGTDLLPETDMILEEINKQTPSLDERMNVAPDFYKAEFWLRASVLNEESNFECIYQAARAGDDIFKTLVNQKKASTKEMLFYSAVTISLYQQALKVDGQISKLRTSFIKYRIGEIYYYLYMYLEYDINSVINQDQFNTHLLLSAEAYFLFSYDDFLQENNGGDIHKEQPFHDAYLAMIEYDLIKIYGFIDKNIIEMCFWHAKSYLNSSFAKPNDTKSCEDIIQKLEALSLGSD